MDIEAAAKQITGPCSCHESYTSRRMVDPGCTFHELSSDIVDALRKAQDEAYERAAEMCERKYPCSRSCSRCSVFLDCSDLLAEEIRSLKSKGNPMTPKLKIDPHLKPGQWYLKSEGK